MGGTTSDGAVTFGIVWTLEVLDELDEVDVVDKPADVEELDELDEPVGITIGVIVGILGDLHFPLI